MKKIKFNLSYFSLVLSLVGFLACLIFLYLGYDRQAQLGIIAISLIVITPEVKNMIKTLLSGQVGIDIIAIVAILASLLLDQYLAAGVIVIMLTGGGALEEFARKRAEREISALLQKKPLVAHVVTNQGERDVAVEKLKVNDRVLVKPGEVVPVDGRLDNGDSSLDESIITGESLPRSVSVGGEVYSGSINLDGAIEIVATKLSKDSQYEQIVKLVSEASTKKAPLVRLADVYSLPFTIVSFSMAGLAWLISGDPVRALAVLVVATPCPLLIATPVAIVSGMSRSASRGVIVKSGGVLEQLSRLNAIAFDKTGTLTKGKPVVSDINSCGVSSDELLKTAASLEAFSNHALAGIVVSTARKKNLKLFKVDEIKEIPGKGIKGKIGGKYAYVGSFEFLKEMGVDTSSPICTSHITHDQTSIYAAVDTRFIGSISFRDPIRNETITTIDSLRGEGLDNFIMLTGDRKQVANKIAEDLGFSKVYSQILPGDKVKILRKLRKNYSPIAMVGDGVNDAPVLAASDVGIALGAKGSTAASEAADAVIMQDDLSRVAEAIEISKRSVNIAKQSIFVGIGLSMVLMVFALFGFIVPLAGAFLQEAVDVAVILNSLRARLKPKGRPALVRKAHLLDTGKYENI